MQSDGLFSNSIRESDLSNDEADLENSCAEKKLIEDKSCQNNVPTYPFDRDQNISINLLSKIIQEPETLYPNETTINGKSPNIEA